VFCSNWFLMPIGSEAVRGRSPDPSRAEPCRADPIQCMPSLTPSNTAAACRSGNQEVPSISVKPEVSLSCSHQTANKSRVRGLTLLHRIR
jgi:hypothetical protein